MRIVYVIALIVICSTQANGQLCKGQYDISPSVGLQSGMALSSQSAEYNGISQSPNFFATGRYYVTNCFAASIAIGYQRFGGSYTGNVYTDNFNENDFTFAIEGQLSYIRKEEFLMYGFFGVGPCFYTKETSEHVYYSGQYTTNYTDTHRASGIKATEQFTPLGFRFGDEIAVFVELGYGYKGIINGGLAFSIGPSEADKKAMKKI